MASRKSTFKNAWWLTGGNLQTIWASKVPRASKITYFYERLRFADGDHTYLAWYPSTSITDLDQSLSTPIVVVLHGLEGSAESNYATGIMQQIEQLGWQGVVLHFRGCFGGPNGLERSYHSGDTADLDHVLKAINQQVPNRPLYAIGYSLGGNVLLKYLGEQGSHANLRAAVAVSVPFELSHASQRLNRGFSKLYQHVLLSSLKRSFFLKFKTLPCPLDKSKVSKVKTIWDYDDLVTAPLHGFRDASDYYRKSSSRQFLKRITVDTLLLHAKDDPLVPPSAIPMEAELGKRTTLECYTTGGHVGFLSGVIPFRPNYWLDNRIREFLLAHST